MESEPKCTKVAASTPTKTTDFLFSSPGSPGLFSRLLQSQFLRRQIGNLRHFLQCCDVDFAGPQSLQRKVNRIIVAGKIVFNNRRQFSLLILRAPDSFGDSRETEAQNLGRIYIAGKRKRMKHFYLRST